MNDSQKSVLIINSLAQRHLGRKERYSLSTLLKLHPCVDSAKLMGPERETKTGGRVRELERQKQRKLEEVSSGVQQCIPDTLSLETTVGWLT